MEVDKCDVYLWMLLLAERTDVRFCIQQKRMGYILL